MVKMSIDASGNISVTLGDGDVYITHGRRPRQLTSVIIQQ
jgi:hypothetical protein